MNTRRDWNGLSRQTFAVRPCGTGCAINVFIGVKEATKFIFNLLFN